MSDSNLQYCKTAIEKASFLTDSEKNLLLELLPGWPEARLVDLAVALKTGPASGPTRVHGANLDELKSKLERETVDFRPKATTSPTGAKNPIKSATPPVKQSATPPLAVNTKSVNPAAPVPPKPIQRPSASVSQPAAMRSGKTLEQILSSQDLAQLDLQILRSGNAANNLEVLLGKVRELSENENILIYDAVRILEKSPLNKLFMQTAITLMDDVSKDRDGAFERVKNIMQAKTGQSLSREEFLLFTAFREKLNKMV